MRNWLRTLDLSTVLGSRDNYAEFLRFVSVIEVKDWTTVPLIDSAGGNFRRDKDPGRRTANAGDFIFYDPWAGQHITQSRAQELRADPCDLPEGHPTEFVFEPLWEGGYDPQGDVYVEEGGASAAAGPSNTGWGHQSGGMVLDQGAGPSTGAETRKAATDSRRRSSSVPNTVVPPPLRIFRPRSEDSSASAVLALQKFLRESGVLDEAQDADWEGLKAAVKLRIDSATPQAGPSEAPNEATSTSMEAEPTAGRDETATSESQAVGSTPMEASTPNQAADPLSNDQAS